MKPPKHLDVWSLQKPQFCNFSYTKHIHFKGLYCEKWECHHIFWMQYCQKLSLKKKVLLDLLPGVTFFFPFQPSMSIKLFTWSGLFEPCSGKCIVSDEILCKLIFNFFFYYYFISAWHLWLYGILFDGSSFKGWKKKMYLPCIQEDVNETSDPFFQNCDFCRPPNILGNWSIHHSVFSCATILRVPDIHL